MRARGHKNWLAGGATTVRSASSPPERERALRAPADTVPWLRRAASSIGREDEPRRAIEEAVCTPARIGRAHRGGLRRRLVEPRWIVRAAVARLRRGRL